MPRLDLEMCASVHQLGQAFIGNVSLNFLPIPYEKDLFVVACGMWWCWTRSAKQVVGSWLGPVWLGARLDRQAWPDLLEQFPHLDGTWVTNDDKIDNAIIMFRLFRLALSRKKNTYKTNAKKYPPM